MKQPVFVRIYRNGQLEGVKQFTAEQIVIGKNIDAQLSLSDDSVSPLHAVIEERDAGYYISDLGSKLGTSKNGAKIFDDALKSGDTIEIGPFKLEFFVGVPKPTQPPQKTEPTTMPPVPAAVAPSAPPPVEVKATVPPPVPKEKTQTTKVASDAVGFKAAPQSVYRPSSQSDLVKSLRKSKGTIVEVVVAWGDRVIGTHHFEEAMDVVIGSDKDCTVVVPLLGMTKSKHTLLRLGTGVRIILSPEMTGDIYTEKEDIPFAELKRKNRLAQVGASYEMDINQGEMARVGLHGDLISIFVRFITEVPKPLVGPIMNLTASETTAVVMSFVVAGLFGLFMALYNPTLEEEENQIEEPIRKAVVIFQPPPKIEKEVVQVAEEVPQQKKVVKVDMEKKEQTTTKKDPGKAGELRPSPQNKKTNIVSGAVQQGASVKTGKEGANAKAETRDVTKTGLLSAFGSKGTQKELSKAYSGAGELQGLAGQATGSAGSTEERAGDNLGGRLKNVGAGGKGTQTVGIAGPGTSGKGTGTYGGGTGGIGKKGTVDLNIGDTEAEFSGSIDREAIRRVIRENLKQFEFCYNQALRRNSDAYGKLEIQWNIEERGRATKAVVKSNSMGDKQMGACVARVIMGLTFPEPPPDQIAQVIYPFVFSSQ